MDRFPEVGPRETRSAKITDQADLPDGEYGFLEMYCDEPDCDCRRATIVVLRPETGRRKIFATISYGWEGPDFYRKWGPHSDPEEMSGPSLNPLGPQTKYSPALLDLFRFLIQSPDYVERLKRHYSMFRESVDREHGGSNRRQTNRVENKRKRRRPHTR